MGSRASARPLASAAGRAPGGGVATVPWPALAALILLAALLRLPTLATQSLWFDEAATWELMRLPFGEMVAALPDRESNPPLFYVLEWLWGRAFGDGALGLRGLPALAGVATVPVAYAIGRRVAGTRAGLATAALVAVNPLLVWFSQEARSYGLVVLLSALALLQLLRACDDPRPRALAWWALAAAAALATHYFAVFVLAPQAAWLLWRHPARRAAVAAVAALAAVGAALLPLLLAQRDNPYDIAADGVLVRLAQLPKQLLLGYRGPAAVASALLGGALVAGALWLLARRADPAARRRALGVGAIGALGVALPLAGAIAGADYLNARNAISAVVPLAALLGAGFAARGAPRAGAALLAALCALSTAIVVAVAVEPRYQRPDWAGLARALGRGDGLRAVVISPANGEAALRYYRRGLARMSDAGVAVREVDVVSVARADAPGAEPRLPAQVGTTLPMPGWRPPERIATDTYVILRFRAPRPIFVQPATLAHVRFSELPPAVATLPPGGG